MHATREPHPALRPYVTRYWGYEERYDEPLARREVPQPHVVLILSLGPEMRVAGETFGSFVAGLTESSVLTEMDGYSNGIQLDLTPLGAFRFLRVPMHELANRVVRFEDVAGRDGDELVARLAGARSWAAQFDVLDETLLARLADAPEPTPSIAWAWHRIVASDGRVAVETLARELRCSRRHLASGFREEVGLPPKAVARILRFSRAARLATAARPPSWSEIAHTCGYYDQAHFNNDFRRFAGSTPTEFVARQLPVGGVAPA